MKLFIPSKCLTFLFIALNSIFTFSQLNIDFNNYQTLSSQGVIPDDFKLTATEKIERDLAIDRPKLPKQYKERFYKGQHNSIDEILHSGICVFGDPVSKYIQDIAKKLLSNDMETFNKLRFYTLKVNETNAFSTDQGIIFFTTGLISQVSTEAQIAYVLAHEIAHYKREHVLERFLNNTKQNVSSIIELSSYSKERELEADADAVELYKQAGYSMDLIEPTFDVLMYSYLPFDEIKIPYDFFDSKDFMVPKFKFPSEQFPITAEENYNDSKSTHPNISKRKKQIETILDKSTSWSGKDFLLGEELFLEIRNIARFETIRNCLIELDITNGLYSTYILEKTFPNSHYLTVMKAKLWLALAQAKNTGVNRPFDSRIHKEGGIATLQAILKKLDKVETTTLAMRQIYDIQSQHPHDVEIQAIYDRMIETASKTKQFDLKKFSKLSYQQAIERNKFYRDSIANLPVDSLNNSVTSSDTKESKYEKIKKKRSADGIVESESFDSTLYYLYGMNDICSDSLFVKRFNNKSELELNASKVKDSLKKLQENLLFPSISNMKGQNVVLVDPVVETLEGSPGTLKKASFIQQTTTELLLKEAATKGYEMNPDIAPNNLSVEGINAFMYLKSALRQNKVSERFNFFPIDYLALEDLRKKYESDIILIPRLVYTNDTKSYPMEIAKPVLGTWYIPPVALMIMTGKLLNAKTTYFSLMAIDLSNGRAETSRTYEISGRPSKVLLGALFYDVFNSSK